MISLLINLLILFLIVGLIYWAFTLFPLPEPLNRIVLLVLAIITIIFVIDLLLGLTGGGVLWRPYGVR